MWKNREFSIRVEENAFKGYEKIMLSSGDCSFFIPMGFMGENGRETARYDCSGFAPLSCYKIERTEDALYILENVLLILGNSVEYLITPARIKITKDTVFYNKETGQVKIAYIPNRAGETDLRKNISSFIKKLSLEVRDENRGYLVEMSRLVTHHNYYIRELVNKAGLFKRQIYIRKKNQMK